MKLVQKIISMKFNTNTIMVQCVVILYFALGQSTGKYEIDNAILRLKFLVNCHQL